MTKNKEKANLNKVAYINKNIIPMSMAYYKLNKCILTYKNAKLENRLMDRRN